MDRRILLGLALSAAVLPMAIVLVLGAARLMAAAGDEAGALGMDRAAVVLAILWTLDLVLLVVCLAIDRSLPPGPPPDDEF